MRHPVQVLVYVVKAAVVKAAVVKAAAGKAANESRNYGWNYLLLHRLANRGDFWQGVTGGAEAGEEIHEAARRELFEETGLVPLSLKQVNYTYTFPVGDSWRHLYAEGVNEITEYVFVATVDDQHAPQLDHREHDQWAWCDFDQTLARLKWPGNIEAVKQCDEYLKRSLPS